MAEPVIRLSDHLLPEQYDPTFPLEWEQNTAASMRSKSGRRRYSLEALPGVPDTMRPCLFWLMAAHRRFCDGKGIASGDLAFVAIKAFVIFLCRENFGIRGVSEITATVLHRYRDYLGTLPNVGRAAAGNRWSCVVQLFRILSEHRAGLVRDMLILHEGFGAISGKHPNLRRTEQVLSREELGTIIAACRTVIVAYRETWNEAHAAISIARDSGYSGEKYPDWEKYGEVLLWLEKLYRSGRSREQRVISRLRGHVFAHKQNVGPTRFGCVSYDAILRRFVPDSTVALAFFVHICVYLAANGMTLLWNLKTDCIEEEVAQGDPELHEVVRMLGETREAVVWSKGRSKLLQRRTFEKNRPWSPPTLIREWLTMSASLRERAPENVRRNVFLVDSKGYGVFALSQDIFDRAMAAWRSTGVQLPPFTLGALRKAALNQGYLLANGNISSVRAVANHVSAETTQRSYLAGPARRLNDELIGRLVRMMTQKFTENEAKAMFREMPSQTAAGARIVETLLSAFCDPRFIYCTDVERVARLLQLSDALTRARARLPLERWSAIYAPLQDIIVREVLPAVQEQIQREARKLCPHLPPLAPIE